MKYKYLKDQNKSFKKQIDEQNKLIKSQTILIDKLTSEKIDLLSKLEIKNINYKKIKKPIDALRLEIKITPYMKDIINTLNSKTEKVVVDNRRIYTNSEKTRIIDELDIVVNKDQSDVWSAINKRVKPFDKTVLAADNFILNAHKNAFTNAIYELANALKSQHNADSSIKL